MGEQDPEIHRIHVGIYDRHKDWADENNVNLSAEIRDRLDDAMGYDE